MRTLTNKSRYHFYLGTPHSHSGYSGDHAKVIATKFNHGVANYELHQPAEVFARAKTNFYDFYYVAVYKEGTDTARAFTAPIWMDNQ